MHLAAVRKRGFLLAAPGHKETKQKVGTLRLPVEEVVRNSKIRDSWALQVALSRLVSEHAHFDCTLSQRAGSPAAGDLLPCVVCPTVCASPPHMLLQKGCCGVAPVAEVHWPESSKCVSFCIMSGERAASLRELSCCWLCTRNTCRHSCWSACL